MVTKLKTLSWIFLFVVLVANCSKTVNLDETVVVGIASPPKTLNPVFATDAYGMRLSNLIFNSIVKLGSSLEIEGDLAQSWTLDQSKMTYTFYLKDLPIFHNGRKATKEDIEFTFSEYKSDRSPFATSLKIVHKVEVLSAQGSSSLQLVLHLSELRPSFLTDLTPIKLLPKGDYIQLGSAFARKPIGTGPYKIVDNSTNQILLRNTQSVGPDQLLFKIVRDDTTRMLKLRNLELDIVQNDLPVDQLKFFQTNPNFKIMTSPGLSMTYLLINMEDPLLQQLDVRRALSASIDRDSIIKHRLQGYAIPASSILTPTNPFFFDATKTTSKREVSTPSLVASKQIILKSSNTQSAVQTAQLIANDFRKLGLKAITESFEWGTFYDDIKNGRFQIATMKWIGVTDPDIFKMAFHSKELPPLGRNRGRYSNPQLDLLLDQAIKELNHEKRIQLYRSVQVILAQELPIIPLWYDTQVVVLNKRIKNYQPPLNGDYNALLSVTKSRDDE